MKENIMNNYTTQEIFSAIALLVIAAITLTVLALAIVPKGLDTTFANDDAIITNHKAWVEANTNKDHDFQY